MNALLTLAVDLFGAAAPVAFLVFLRIGAAMALLPGLGHVAVPVRVRLCLTIALTAIVAPAVAPALAPLDPTPGLVIRCLATETLAGLSLGLMLRLLVIALEIAGAIAAQSTSLSQLFGAGGEPMPAMSHLFVFAGLALAMMSGLHVRIAGALILSYDAIPPAVFLPAAAIRDWSVSHIGSAFALGFSLAAPFVVAGLVYNVALGAINRAMPQLMVSFVGAPAMTAGALLLLLLAAPAGLAIWLAALGGVLSDPFGAAP